jgi:hypothetical protein
LYLHFLITISSGKTAQAVRKVTGMGHSAQDHTFRTTSANQTLFCCAHILNIAIMAWITENYEEIPQIGYQKVTCLLHKFIVHMKACLHKLVHPGEWQMWI